MFHHGSKEEVKKQVEVMSSADFSEKYSLVDPYSDTSVSWSNNL